MAVYSKVKTSAKLVNAEIQNDCHDEMEQFKKCNLFFYSRNMTNHCKIKINKFHHQPELSD